MNKIGNKITFVDKLKLYVDILRYTKKQRTSKQVDSEYNNGTWNQSFNDIDFESWQGNYNVKDGHIQRPMSFNDKIFKGPWDEYIEQYKSQILDVLDKYLDQPVVELGCGLGHMLFSLYHRNFKKLEGYDISENAISLLKKYSKSKNYQINFDVLDMIKPYPKGIFEDKIIYTHTSLEQVTHYIPNVLKNIIDAKPKIVINFEVDYTTSSFWSKRYMNKADYQTTLVQELQKLEKEGKIEIISIKKIPLSISPVNRPSCIMWKPV